MDILVTVSKDIPELIESAQEISRRINQPFVTRGNNSLRRLFEEYQVHGVLVVERNRLVLRSPRGGFFFHPSMAKNRVRELKAGKGDMLIKAAQLTAGDRFLDCTLGLGSDAIVASFVVGSSGEVVGVESQPLIELITSWGLQHYQDEDQDLEQAMRRIKVVNQPYQEYLAQLPDKSYDVVYFDPMFRKGQHLSSSMQPLRDYANHQPVSIDAIREGKRVAVKRIVIKEQNDSPEFARLGVDEVVGGKYSFVAYGIIYP